jgi:hypothetical protein
MYGFICITSSSSSSTVTAVLTGSIEGAAVETVTMSGIMMDIAAAGTADIVAKESLSPI